MNRKIAISGFSVLTALTLLTTSAFAAFTTQANASGSTFSTGTDNLLVSTDPVTGFSGLITSPFTATKVTPGFNKVYTFYLKNDDASSTDDLNVSATFAGGTADVVLDAVLSTQFSCTDGAIVTNAPAFNVTSMRGGQVNLGKILNGHTATCKLTVSLPLSADNTVSGKTTSFDVLFNGEGVTPVSAE
jgi:hypothetical protein